MNKGKNNFFIIKNLMFSQIYKKREFLRSLFYLFHYELPHNITETILYNNSTNINF